MMLLRRMLVVTLLMVMVGVGQIKNAYAASGSCAAVQDGYWDMPATWGVTSLSECNGQFEIPADRLVAIRNRARIQLPQVCGDLGELTVYGKLVNEGSFTLGCDAGSEAAITLVIQTGGVIENRGWMGLNAASFLNNGTFQNHGTFNNEGSLSNSAGTVTNSGVLSNANVIENRDGGLLENGSGAQLTNTDTGTISNLADSYFHNDGLVTNGHWLINEGTLLNEETGQIMNNGGLYNFHELVTSGTLTNTYVLANYYANSQIVNHGELINRLGGEFEMGYDAKFNNYSVFLNEGFVTNGKSHFNNYGVVDNPGIISNSFVGTLTNYHEITNGGAIFNTYGGRVIFKCDAVITVNPVTGPVIYQCP